MENIKIFSYLVIEYIYSNRLMDFVELIADLIQETNFFFRLLKFIAAVYHQIIANWLAPAVDNGFPSISKGGEDIIYWPA